MIDDDRIPGFIEAVNKAQDALVQNIMLEQEVIQYVNEKSFKGHTELDTDLYSKINKRGIDDIVMGNFVRIATDRVRSCSRIIYPSQDISSIDNDDWSIKSNKLKFEVEAFIFSKEEMEELVKDIINIIESTPFDKNSTYWVSQEEVDIANRFQREKEEKLYNQSTE